MTKERIDEEPKPKFFVSLDGENGFVLGQEYPVKVGLQDIPNKGLIFDFEFNAFGSVKLANEEEWYKSVKTEEDNQTFTFNIKADSIGAGYIEVGAYRGNRWLSKIKLDVEVKPTP